MSTTTALPRLAFGGLSLLLLALLPSQSFAQVNFYSAPAPSDVSPTVALPAGVSEGMGTDSSVDIGSGSTVSALPTGGTIMPDGRPDLGFLSKIPVQLSFAVREGYDDNVFTTRTNKDSSFYTNFAGGANYNFGNSRLQLSANLGGGITYYYTRPGDKTDFNGQFALNATYLATPRLTLTVATSTAYLSQPDLTISGGTNRQDGDYIYSTTSLAAAYQWSEKFSTVTSYNISTIYYMDNNLNDNQGRVDQTFAQSGRWLILPKTTGVAEYRFSPTLYFDADLNTYNNFFLVGFDQTFNPRFKWNVRAGLQVGFDDNQTDGDSVYIGPYGESTLTYQFGPASYVAWTMRYGTEASGIDDVTQRQTFRTGLSVTHGFTPRISATLGTNYQVNYYDQNEVINPFYENLFDVTVSLNFKINRFVYLQAGYQFTADVAPDAIEREYTRNVAYFGANFAF